MSLRAGLSAGMTRSLSSSPLWHKDGFTRGLPMCTLTPPRMLLLKLLHKRLLRSLHTLLRRTRLHGTPLRSLQTLSGRLRATFSNDSHDDGILRFVSSRVPLRQPRRPRARH